MKTFLPTTRYFLIATGFSFLIFVFSCNKTYESYAVNDKEEFTSSVSWSEMLAKLKLYDLSSNSIIVQNTNSIAEAIRAANPGDAIFVAPGIYKESINIDKAGIKIIWPARTRQR